MNKIELNPFSRDRILHPHRVDLPGPAVGALSFPLIVTSPGPSSNLTEYVRGCHEELDILLVRYGALLFRGFDVRRAATFAEAIAALDPEIIRYTERSSPRSAIADGVYTSTDHPPDQDIVLHSEQSYTLTWPRLICFYCEVVASAGGNTPIADNRRIIQHLSADLRARFETLGVLYQRTYTPGLGVTWQTAFQTESRDVVGEFCRERGIQVEWLSDGRLRTRQKRSAFQNHPVSGERIWFNHALFFHVTSLDAAVTNALVESVGLENVPTNTFFGNGESFSADDLGMMRAAVDREKRSFDWQRGDVLVLDNMLCQHGRDPYVGPRRVLTVMARAMTVSTPSIATPQ